MTSPRAPHHELDQLAAAIGAAGRALAAQVECVGAGLSKLSDRLTRHTTVWAARRRAARLALTAATRCAPRRHRGRFTAQLLDAARRYPVACWKALGWPPSSWPPCPGSTPSPDPTRRGPSDHHPEPAPAHPATDPTRGLVAASCAPPGGVLG